MKFAPMVPLETSHLLLRKARWEDVSDYYRYLTSDPEVARGMLWEASPDPVQAEKAIEKLLDGYAQGNRWQWIIADRQSGLLMGTIALLAFDQEQNSCSFAYMLGRAFWGKGYGTQALEAVFRFAFAQMEMDTIRADHFADNPASGRAMEKAGMRKGDTIPGRYEKNGVSHAAVEYSLTREQWRLCQGG